MADYRLLADNDPGGDLDAAFAAMAAETETVQADRFLTYVGIAKEAGFAIATALERRITTLISAGQMPQWVHEALEYEGLNVNDAQVEAALGNMVDGSTFTAANKDAVLALKNQTAKKYPGIELGHLQNAREWKAIWVADPGGDIDAALTVVQQLIPRCGKGDLQKARGLWGEK